MQNGWLRGRSRAVVIAPLVIVAACTTGARSDTDDAATSAAGTINAAIIPEVFHTARDTMANIDSPAVWHGPDNRHWVLSTAKTGDVIRVDDAVTGAHVRDVGGTGTARGQLRRPNGIVVADDLVFVVERDNARVQVFSLPEFESLGVFGQPELRLPYGIALHRELSGTYAVWITDAYEFVEDEVPADSLLGERVRQYRVTIERGGVRGASTGTRAGGSVRAEQVRVFGETSGPGVLKVVESIAIDPANNRLMIAEELEGESMIKVYTLDGRFSGETIASSYFPNQAEGVILYACDDGGYWVTTDQGKDVNTFHVFDRASLAYRGSFRGPTVLNTDGIALTQRAFDAFPAGAFYAIHDDGNVAAFSWQAIANALGLRSDCVQPQ